MNIILIILGGALGALSRYGFSLGIKFVNTPIFLSTLIVNCIGCFFMGLFINTFLNHGNYKSLFCIGFLGSFTTFSTYILEVFELVKDGQLKFAFLYLLGSVILGLFFLFLGYKIKFF